MSNTWYLIRVIMISAIMWDMACIIGEDIGSSYESTELLKWVRVPQISSQVTEYCAVNQHWLLWFCWCGKQDGGNDGWGYGEGVVRVDEGGGEGRVKMGVRIGWRWGEGRVRVWWEWGWGEGEESGGEGGVKMRWWWYEGGVAVWWWLNEGGGGSGVRVGWWWSPHHRSTFTPILATLSPPLHPYHILTPSCLPHPQNHNNQYWLTAPYSLSWLEMYATPTQFNSSVFSHEVTNSCPKYACHISNKYCTGWLKEMVKYHILHGSIMALNIIFLTFCDECNLQYLRPFSVLRLMGLIMPRPVAGASDIFYSIMVLTMILHVYK